MSRRSQYAQTRRHLLIYDEDWEFLKRQYGPDSINKTGISDAVRNIVHAYVARLQAKVEQKIDSASQETKK